MSVRYFAVCILVFSILFSVGCSSDTSGGKSYIGNKKSRIFHYSNCKWAQKISSNNIVVIDNRKKAVNIYHMRPCKSCRP